MRLFLFALGMIASSILFFFIGAFARQPEIMLAVMCIFFPLSMWISGYATRGANIKITIEQNTITNAKKSMRKEFN